MKFSKSLLLVACLGCSVDSANAAETLVQLTADRGPQTFAEMWAGFDPRAEALEVEMVKQWEQENVTLRIVRFRIGVFKGQQARLAAVYGFPKRVAGSERKIPGLLQIHGGGQYADHRACLLNAKRGYATLSIAWAGRISAPGYRVSPREVKRNEMRLLLSGSPAEWLESAATVLCHGTRDDGLCHSKPVCSDPNVRGLRLPAHACK